MKVTRVYTRISKIVNFEHGNKMRKHVLLSLHEYEVRTQAKWPPAETYPSWYEAWYEATSSIITLPWMGWESITRSPLLPPLPPRISSGFPNNLPMPIHTLEWREALWEYSALPKNTTHWPCQVLDPDLSTQSPAHYTSQEWSKERPLSWHAVMPTGLKFNS